MAFDMHKLAYCGIYCDQCSFKTANEENNPLHIAALPERLSPLAQSDLSRYRCECCKGQNICGPCKIKDCARERSLDSCADCDSFPCALIKNFADDGLAHHAWAVDNLNAIKKQGVEAWYAALQPKLICHCGRRKSWYYACPQHD